MATFIAAPFDRDPAVKKALFVAMMQTFFPGWVEDDSRVDSAIGTADAAIAAQLDETASEATTAVFRFWAARIVPVPPVDASAATGTTEWTMVDDAGYTVLAGTAVAKETDDGLIGFQTTADAVIAPGDTVAAGVPVASLIESATGNDLTGALTLIDSLAFVDTVELEAATSGGLDAEDDDVYLSRATTEIQTLKPATILPPDVAILARTRIADVYRVLVVDGYNPDDDTTGNERMLTLFPLDDTGADFAVAPGDPLDVLFNGDALTSGFREVNFVFNFDTPTRTAINVAFTFTTWPGNDPTVVKADGEQAVRDFLSPLNWGIPESGDPREWELDDKVRLSDIYVVLGNVSGLRHVTALTVNAGAVDVTLPGAAPLPTAGTITGTPA